jgi:hypothetical protein
MVLTRDFIDTIVKMVEAGHYTEPSAKSLGIKVSTFRAWHWEGKLCATGRRKVNTPHQKLCQELYERIDMARGKCYVKELECFLNADNKIDLAKWKHVLRVKYPKEWHDGVVMSRCVDQSEIFRVLEEILPQETYEKVLNALHSQEGIEAPVSTIEEKEDR